MNAPRSGRPDPDGHHDDLSADDIAGLSLVVPPDARELDADRDQWLRESQREPRDDTSPIFPATRTVRRRQQRRRLSVTAAIVLVSIVIVTAAGLVGSFVRHAPTATAPSVALADAGLAPGQAGALLPDVNLASGQTAIAARSLRPAVIALIPDTCDHCTELLKTIRLQATEYGLSLTIVGTTDQVGQLAELDRSLGSVRLEPLVDTTGQFTQPYAASALTLLLVRDDGVVADIVRNPSGSVRLEPVLVALSSNFGT
ncbi:MAG TPA: hypothetical protein VMT88_05645 [Actinomycetes bacterium]|nr:hypothetical protein [Actinomycetes bacterium]